MGLLDGGGVVEHGGNGDNTTAGGQGVCTACTAGKYQSASGSSECVECPAGSYCLARSSGARCSIDAISRPTSGGTQPGGR